MEAPLQNTAEHQKEKSSSSSQVHAREASLSKNGTIQEKIEELAKSLADATVYSNSRSMESLRKLRQEAERFQNKVGQAQKKMIEDLNEVEAEVLSLERQAMIHDARSRIRQQQINDLTEDFDKYLRRNADSFSQTLSLYADKISDSKVRIVETESTIRQKALKFQRDNQNKLISIQMNLISNQDRADRIRDHYLKKIKNLKFSLEQEGRAIEEQEIKALLALEQLRATMSGKLEAERIKQRDGFQQHYRTLEEIFKVLETETISQ